MYNIYIYIYTNNRDCVYIIYIYIYRSVNKCMSTFWCSYHFCQITITAVCFFIARWSCGTAEDQWLMALSILTTMENALLSPNVISYNSAISACAKGGHWLQALAVLQRMEFTDVISYSGSISACDAWFFLIGQLGRQPLEPPRNAVAIGRWLWSCWLQLRRQMWSATWIRSWQGLWRDFLLIGRLDLWCLQWPLL